jgi:hypothetical protein
MLPWLQDIRIELHVYSDTLDLPGQYFQNRTQGHGNPQHLRSGPRDARTVIVMPTSVDPEYGDVPKRRLCRNKINPSGDVGHRQQTNVASILVNDCDPRTIRRW